MNEEPSFPKNLESYSGTTKSVDSVVSLIVILHEFVGLLLFITVVLIFFYQPSYAGPEFFMSLTYLFGGLILMILPIFFILGIAIWSRRSWAWKTSVIANVICLIVTIFGIVILPAMVNILLLLMLNSTDVRTALET